MVSIRIFAHGKAQAGKEKALREHVMQLLKSGQSEDGLEIYEAFESLDEQEFIFSEQYVSEQVLNQHLNTDRFKEIMSNIYPLIDGEIRIWTVSQLKAAP